MGQHSTFPLPGSQLGSELLYNSEVDRVSMFPFSSFRFIRKSCIPHKHPTFIGFFAIIISLLLLFYWPAAVGFYCFVYLFHGFYGFI